MTVFIILNIIFIFLVFLSCFISSLVPLLIFIYIRPSTSNVSLLLTCNTYLTIIFFCMTLFDIGGHSLYGHLNPSLTFAGRWCEIRAYFPHVCFCAYYYSFVLQAIFRLFRVVFYRKKILQSFGIFLLAVFIQWLLAFLFICPHLIFHDFQYQPLVYNCWISFRNIRGMLLATLTIYGCPLVLIFFIYTCMLRYIHRRIYRQQKPRRANQRDVIILRRILLLLFFLIMIGIPTLSLFTFYLMTDYLTPFAYDIQAINISLGLVITSITLVFITPKIRHIFRRNEQLVTNSTPIRQYSKSIKEINL